MSRAESAVVLFTLPPDTECERKRLGRGPALFESLIDHLRSVSRALQAVDLLVSSPAGPCDIRQRGRDFGESLRLVIEDAFASGYRRVVVIGNDAPEMTSRYLARALDALDGARAVLGPAEDGGYNLIGLTEPCTEAFASMPWGSPDVAEITRARLERAGFEVVTLETLPDIDTALELWRFFRRAIATSKSMRLRRLVFRMMRLSAPQDFPREPSIFLALRPPTRNYLLRAPPS